MICLERLSVLKSLNSIKSTFITCLLIGAFLSPSLALADVYRCDNKTGVITLSNIEKGTNCKKMVLPPPDKRLNQASGADASKGSSPATPISIQSKNKSSYDAAVSERKRIIQEEMDLENGRLGAVNSKISALNQLKKKTPAQEQELASLQKKQTLYQSNLSLLQKELGK